MASYFNYSRKFICRRRKYHQQQQAKTQSSSKEDFPRWRIYQFCPPAACSPFPTHHYNGSLHGQGNVGDVSVAADSPNAILGANIVVSLSHSRSANRLLLHGHEWRCDEAVCLERRWNIEGLREQIDEHLRPSVGPDHFTYCFAAHSVSHY